MTSGRTTLNSVTKSAQHHPPRRRRFRALLCPEEGEEEEGTTLLTTDPFCHGFGTSESPLPGPSPAFCSGEEWVRADALALLEDLLADRPVPQDTRAHGPVPPPPPASQTRGSISWTFCLCIGFCVGDFWWEISIVVFVFLKFCEGHPVRYIRLHDRAEVENETFPPSRPVDDLRIHFPRSEGRQIRSGAWRPDVGRGICMCERNGSSC